TRSTGETTPTASTPSSSSTRARSSSSVTSVHTAPGSGARGRCAPASGAGGGTRTVATSTPSPRSKRLAATCVHTPACWAGVGAARARSARRPASKTTTDDAHGAAWSYAAVRLTLTCFFVVAACGSSKSGDPPAAETHDEPARPGVLAIERERVTI